MIRRFDIPTALPALPVLLALTVGCVAPSADDTETTDTGTTSDTGSIAGAWEGDSLVWYGAYVQFPYDTYGEDQWTWDLVVRESEAAGSLTVTPGTYSEGEWETFTRGVVVARIEGNRWAMTIDFWDDEVLDLSCTHAEPTLDCISDNDVISAVNFVRP